MTDTELDPQTARYFLTYTGVKLPLVLKEPLEPAAIANRNTYFRAWFDEAGRMTAFDKLVYGEVELSHRYRYHPNGSLEAASVTDAEGETTELAFDAAGVPQPT